MKVRHSLFIGGILLLFGGLAVSFDKAASVTKSVNTLSKPPACPTIDDSEIAISNATCGGSDGSITGITGTGSGTLQFTWYDFNNNIVGTNADLLNVRAGYYKLQVKDSTKCLPVSKGYYVLVRNPIIIDNTNVVITPPGCNQANGSITNVVASNATKYQWTDTKNVIVGNNQNLLNVVAGSYTLTASNATGCSASFTYNITNGNNAPTITYYTTGSSDCGSSGLFHVTFDLKPTDPIYPYTITDATGKVYFSGGLIYNPVDSTRIIIPAPRPPGPPPDPPFPGLPAGTFTLNTQSPGGCFINLLTFTIPQSNFAIDTSQVSIHTDVCSQNLGTITNLSLVGGPSPTESRLKGPARDPRVGYFWTDSNGSRVVTDNLFLAGVPSGKYTLYIVNDDLCATPPVTFFIPDSISSATKPILNDIKICLPGTVGLDVLNKDPHAHYQLYDSTQTLIDTSIAGYFARKVDKTTVFYVSSVNGICPSPKGKVTVTVVDPGVSFPNAFTPNSDGINDYWQINGLDQYPGTEVTVFNRNGQRVYHSINYTKPFDGRYNGKELPEGVYYYIIDTKKPDCRAGVSGNLTIIR